MPDTIKTGTILIREGTPLPETLRFESELYSAGWRSVQALDGNAFGRKTHEVGWTFLRLTDEIGATVFGIDERKTLRRAIERVLTDQKSQRFNSLEIVRVNSATSKRFLGVLYVSVSARPRHIQESAFLIQTTDIKLKQPEVTAAL